MAKSDAPQDRRTMRRWALKLSVSALVLGAVLWLLPTERVWSAILGIPPWLWATVLALFLAGHVVAAAKWWLLAAQGSNVAFPTALRAHFAGLAANLCLPGVAGGDVIRAGMIFRGSDQKAQVALGSLADRLLDSLTLLMLACLGALLCFGPEALSTGPLPLVAGFVLLAVLGCAAVVLILPRIAKGGMLRRIADALEAFRRRPGRLALAMLMSLAIQAGFVWLNVMLAAASGITAPAAAWYFAWPLAKLIAVVPVSLAGLGVREAGLAALMAPFGAEAATVVAVGLMWQAVLFTTGALGGLMLVSTSGGRRARAAFAEPLSPQDIAGRDA